MRRAFSAAFGRAMIATQDAACAHQAAPGRWVAALGATPGMSASAGVVPAAAAPQPWAAGARRCFADTPTVWPEADAERAGTADLCDVFVPEPVDKLSTRAVQIATPGLFRDYGGRLKFSGQASTVFCFENNPLVRKALEEGGAGRVLVVDAGGSMRCAVLGDNLAESAQRNGWSGIIVHGCIRDSDAIGKLPNLGVKALATHPLKSSKRDPGFRDVPVTFAGVTIRPGDWVYADGDGVLVSPTELRL
ncbi:MAG: ribonuclease E inhibitor RraA/Dimethylmenaquinone methyltransferase [Monoraphidium minutum]|nr:MAG: ribonuclease E inhibitor RraA/Dimethylmenaquinone methyltransferase [Monoraphidium minutum]